MSIKSALHIAVMLSPGKQEREKSQQRLPLPAVCWDSLLRGFHTMAWRQHHHELCTHNSLVPGSWGVFAMALRSFSWSCFCDLITSSLCPLPLWLKKKMEEETNYYQLVQWRRGSVWESFQFGLVCWEMFCHPEWSLILVFPQPININICATPHLPSLQLLFLCGCSSNLHKVFLQKGGQSPLIFQVGVIFFLLCYNFQTSFLSNLRVTDFGSYFKEQQRMLSGTVIS